MAEITRIYRKENEAVEIVTELVVRQGDRLTCDLGEIDALIIHSLGLLPGEQSGQFRIDVVRLD